MRAIRKFVSNLVADLRVARSLCVRRLSVNGQRFYYGALQVVALDVTNNLNYFAESIYAATGDFAFGESAYYSPVDGALLGDLGFSTSVYALSDDGGHIWAFAPSTDGLYHYVVPEPTSICLVLMIGLSLARRKSA